MMRLHEHTGIGHRRACLEAPTRQVDQYWLCASYGRKVASAFINTQGPVTDPLTEEL